MKPFLISILTLLTFISHAQNIDTIINAGIYTSYYSYILKNPAYVTYKLYKGGGDCNRKSLKFKNVGLPAEAKDKDYSASGYDKGHLANAEDFANDCDNQAVTFRYYNCLPQTPKLNRGIWKKYETTLRKISQKDSLLILCGGIFDSTTIGNKVSVPNYCWKIAARLSTGEVIFCGLFPNNASNSIIQIHDKGLAGKYMHDLLTGTINFSVFTGQLYSLREQM